MQRASLVKTSDFIELEPVLLGFKYIVFTEERGKVKESNCFV